MRSWIPIVECIRRIGEEPRFIVTGLDPKGPHIRGPDGGKTIRDIRKAKFEPCLPNAAYRMAKLSL